MERKKRGRSEKKTRSIKEECDWREMNSSAEASKNTSVWVRGEKGKIFVEPLSFTLSSRLQRIICTSNSLFYFIYQPRGLLMLMCN